MIQKIRKAVFPVAGLGSRFLPATKANPKEMLPIVDKPLIQYAVEDALEAGITELIFVTSSSKHAIEDYFDTNYELESRLILQQKHELLDIVKNILPSGITCIYLRQPEPLGLGDAVLRAMPVVGHEPFAVLLADDLMDCPDKGCLHQMCDVYQDTESSVIAVEPIAPHNSDKYGVVVLENKTHVGMDMNSQYAVAKMAAIVEKPSPSDAPSNLGVAGRYILTPMIFECLQQTTRGAGNEIQLTDAISRLLQFESVLALKFNGKRYDCGAKLGYLKATVKYGLKHSELADDFKNFLQGLDL